MEAEERGSVGRPAQGGFQRERLDRALARASDAALQKSGYPLQTREHALAAAASGALLGASLLGLIFPRFLAWPRSASSTEPRGAARRPLGNL